MSSTPLGFNDLSHGSSMPDDPFKELPFLRTTSTVNPQPPLSFSTVIEQDHSQINAVSLQLAKLLSAKSRQTHQLRRQQLETLRLVAWRLIRHDISEEIVMRPAFVQYLGHEGKAMGDHDREDHERARKELLDLYAAYEALDFDNVVGFKLLRQRYVDLMTELLEHMKSESGTDIPRLESMLGRAESEELGRQYLKTQALAPDLQIDGERVWSDVCAYVNESVEKFWKVWKRLEAEDAKKPSRL